MSATAVVCYSDCVKWGVGSRICFYAEADAAVRAALEWPCGDGCVGDHRVVVNIGGRLRSLDPDKVAA